MNSIPFRITEVAVALNGEKIYFLLYRVTDKGKLISETKFKGTMLDLLKKAVLAHSEACAMIYREGFRTASLKAELEQLRAKHAVKSTDQKTDSGL